MRGGHINRQEAGRQAKQRNTEKKNRQTGKRETERHENVQKDVNKPPKGPTAQIPRGFPVTETCTKWTVLSNSKTYGNMSLYTIALRTQPVEQTTPDKCLKTGNLHDFNITFSYQE